MTEAIVAARLASRVLAHVKADAESQWPRMWPRSSEPGCSHLQSDPMGTQFASDGA